MNIPQELTKYINEIFPEKQDSENFLNIFKSFMDLNNYEEVCWQWIGMSDSAMDCKNLLIKEITKVYSFVFVRVHIGHGRYKYNGNNISFWGMDSMSSKRMFATDFSCAVIPSKNVPKVSDEIREFIGQNYPDVNNIQSFTETLNLCLEKPKVYNVHTWCWNGENSQAKVDMFNFLKQKGLAREINGGMMIGDYCILFFISNNNYLSNDNKFSNFPMYSKQTSTDVVISFEELKKKHKAKLLELSEKHKAELLELVKKEAEKFTLTNLSGFAFNCRMCNEKISYLVSCYIHEDGKTEICSDCYKDISPPVKKTVEMTEKEYQEYIAYKNKGD